MDALYIFVWWVFFFVLGIINFPLTYLFFQKFSDRGYAFSKVIGLLVLTYLSFLGGIIKLVPFSSTSLYLLSFVLLIINFYLFIRNKNEIISSLSKKWKIILFEESAFLILLAGWSIIRGFSPDIRGLEKFMDYGFINSILNSKYFPPTDMWYAGGKINYYWFGHLYTTIATKMTFIPSSITYNLMIATILGLLGTGVFSLIYTLFRSLPKSIHSKAFSAGIISLLMVCFASNFQTPIYLIKNGFNKYWYPDATRFVGYFPPTEDKTIHEFPIYSFVVSDLHGHLLDIPFNILFLAFLFSFILGKKKAIFGAGLTLSAMFMTNTWDFLNYGLFCGVLFLLSAFFANKNNWPKLASYMVSGTIIATLAIIFSLPFILNFSSIAEGIKMTHSHTPFWQLGVLWGYGAFLFITFVTTLIFFLKGKLLKADLFVFSLLITAFILIVLPEFFYVKDIYIASHYRANTMFKLTYSSFVMIYLSSGYIFFRLISKIKNVIPKFGITIIFATLFTSLIIYVVPSVKSYYGGKRNWTGLDGEKWVSLYQPERQAAIGFFRTKVTKKVNILEANGDSYTDFALVSSYTGNPTPLGWFVHEWLWRGSSTYPQARAADIERMYTSTNLDEIKTLLTKYEIKYVLVGSQEKEKYPRLIESNFLKLGKKVFNSPGINIYEIN